MSAARDGVDVRLLLPATNDLPIVSMVSRAGYRELLESGVRIFEYGGPMMHAKTTVADGWSSRVGSTNMNVTVTTPERGETSRPRTLLIPGVHASGSVRERVPSNGDLNRAGLAVHDVPPVTTFGLQ